MTAVSVLFYMPVNVLANRVGKKRILLVAFVIFTCAFAFAGALGSGLLAAIPPMAQGLILSIVGAIPMAAFGILPQAIVANIADASSKTTGQDRQGMFYAARTFAMKMGPVGGDAAVYRREHDWHGVGRRLSHCGCLRRGIVRHRRCGVRVLQRTQGA